MKNIKKPISVVLALMMILCAFSSLSFAASAAETNTISVNSNLGSSKSYSYSQNSTQFAVTYYLQSSYKIVDVQAKVNYDSSVLKLDSTTKAKTISPIFAQGSYVANIKMENEIRFNANSLNLFDFTNNGVFFTATFDIVGSGDTSIDMNVEVITATTANDYDELNGAPVVQLVYKDEIESDKFAFTSEGVVTTPVTNEVSLTGDIDLALAETSDGVYSAETKLSAGTYNFKVDNNGTELGNGTAFTDEMTNVTYKSSWKSATPFTATGGTYTFTFDTNTNKLTVEHQAEGVSVIGDINLQLTETSNGVYSAETKLSAGTYNFKINNNGTEYGKGAAYTDTISGVVYKTSWKSATAFTATGGTYTFTFDTNTNKVTVERQAEGVSVIGDISLQLAESSNGVYSAETKLSAGTYNFKINNNGTEYGKGAAYTDTITNVLYKTSWKSATAFTATGGTYTFTFDTNTNKVTVAKK
jgi:hypothetical protein